MSKRRLGYGTDRGNASVPARPDNFVGMAKATASARLEGNDRCYLVNEVSSSCVSEATILAARSVYNVVCTVC